VHGPVVFAPRVTFVFTDTMTQSTPQFLLLLV